MQDKKKYFKYLSTLSYKSYLYRKYFLYPKLFKFMNGKILDLGCGIGDLLQYNQNILGVDINENNIAYCKSIGLNAFLMKENKIPFNSFFFNTVVMDNVIEHISDPEEILNEVKRVLKNNGIFIIGVPGIKGFKEDDDHKKFYNINSIKKILDDFFVINRYFYTPMNSNLFDRIFRQHCLYLICNKIEK